MTTVAAVDCGATSIRVCRVDLDAPTLTPEVVHRFPHSPYHDASGHLRWDWKAITGGIHEGLRRCLERGPLDSIGVDTWAVDYGLLDDNGGLIGDPFSYRDHRTDGYQTMVDAFGADSMYRINGLQLQPFNTVFQLARHDPTELSRAANVLWLPELIVHDLTGVAVTERTSAGSSGLVDLQTGDWSPEMLALSGVDRGLLGTITVAGQVVGEWQGIPVSLVGGHDTASAVVGMGTAAAGGSAFVASGTWMLAGIERVRPDTTEWARRNNFTNESGALGGLRFLQNITGFWLLEQCRRHWGNPTIESLLAAADRIGPNVPIVDVDDDRLRSPDDMLAVYTTLAGVPRSADPGLITRSIVESIAAQTATVIGELGEVQPFDDVILFGGAARMTLLIDRIAELTGRAIRVGSAEAAALGNAIVQGIAIGHFTSIDEGRQHITCHERSAR